MKRFDLFGILAVITWLCVIAGFAFASSQDTVNSQNPTNNPSSLSPNTIAAITAGDSWMILKRDRQEVGYVHETRTPMDEGGWLLEYEMMMQIELMGQPRLLSAHTRAWLANDMVLKQFQADAQSFLGQIKAKGQVKDNTLHIDFSIAGKASALTIPLEKPAKLSQNALLDLVSQPENLKPNTTYTQEVFDPIQAKIVPVTYTYIQRKEVSSYDITYDTFHFRQKLLGQEMDVYITQDGTTVIQEFPMRTVGAIITKELAKSRTGKIKQKLKKSERQAKKEKTTLPSSIPSKANPKSLGVQGALQQLDTLFPSPKPKDKAP